MPRGFTSRVSLQTYVREIPIRTLAANGYNSLSASL